MKVVTLKMNNKLSSEILANLEEHNGLVAANVATAEDSFKKKWFADAVFYSVQDDMPKTVYGFSAAKGHYTSQRNWFSVKKVKTPAGTVSCIRPNRRYKKGKDLYEDMQVIDSYCNEEITLKKAISVRYPEITNVSIFRKIEHFSGTRMALVETKVYVKDRLIFVEVPFSEENKDKIFKHDDYVEVSRGALNG